MPDTTVSPTEEPISLDESEEIAFQQAVIIQNSLGGLIGGLGNVFPIALIKAVMIEVVGLDEFWEQLLQQEAEKCCWRAQITVILTQRGLKKCQIFLTTTVRFCRM